MLYRTRADPQVKGQIIKKESLYLLSTVCASMDEINDPAVKQSHCRSEEYDIEKNKQFED